MKSIIQEGTTVAKAVEQAWQQVGMPQEFTVKVLQHPEHNFLGMTKITAKIAIIFKEDAAPVAPANNQRTQNNPRRKPVVQEERQERRGAEHNNSRPAPAARQPRQQEPRAPRAERVERPESQEAQERQERVFWTEPMVSAMTDWLAQSLQAMEMSHVTFDSESKNYLLKISFNKPLHENPDKEKDIFRNFSLLMLQALKNKLKRPLRGFKILLTRA